MYRSYSLLVTNDELVTSPYVQSFNYLYDLTLTLGKEEVVNFLIQAPLTPHQRKHLEVGFDPYEIDITSINVTTYRRQTLVTLRLLPRDVGTTRISFAYPDPAHNHPKSGVQPKQLVAHAP